MKRSEKSQAIFSEDSYNSMTPPDSPKAKKTKIDFTESDSHYLKRVMAHPERDMENMVRVIDQPTT